MTITSNSTTTATLFGLPLPSLNFGNNIIDVSSLTTLIGSTVGESLVLGNRGAAGIAWASTSSFGLLWIIRGCINGASPGWLREVIGIRSGVSDSSLGMELNRHSIRSGAIRKNLGQAIAIVCENAVKPEGGKHIASNDTNTAREVYVFDRSTSNKIRVIPETGADPLRIFAYGDHIYFRIHDTQFQVIAIGLSLLKLIEMAVLLSCDAALLAVITTLPWTYFFVVAVNLEIHEIRLKRKAELDEGELDIITGTLPTVTRPGGPKKVILGMIKESKHTFLWGFLWGIGAILCIICLTMSYFIMGQQNQGISFIWLCFQVLWMLARTILHYLADIEDPHGHRTFAEKTENKRPKSWKRRVLRLTASVGKYQTLLHPRGETAYKNDCFSIDDIPLLFRRSTDLFPLSPEQATAKIIEVELIQVVGDPMLSSAAWIVGSKVTPMDVYDCCIVTFSLTVGTKDLQGVVSIPAARVYNYATPTPDGENNLGLREYVPKGTPNTGNRMYWWYFVPATESKWLLIKRAAESGLGKSEGLVLSNSQLTRQLQSGELNVDIKDARDIQTIVDLSQSVFKSCLSQLVE